MSTKRTTVDLDAELLKLVAMEKAKGRVGTLGQAFEEALREWLSGSGIKSINQNQTVTGVGNAADQRNTVNSRMAAETADPIASLEPEEREIAVAAVQLHRENSRMSEMLHTLLKDYRGKPLKQQPVDTSKKRKRSA